MTLFVIILVIVGGALFIVRLYRSRGKLQINFDDINIYYCALCLLRCIFLAEKAEEASGAPKPPRIRKRDRVLYFGKKVLKNVRNIQSAGANKRKRIISKLTKKLLNKKDNLPAQLQVLEPPAEYLQEDDRTITDQRLPPEVSYMLQSIR